MKWCWMFRIRSISTIYIMFTTLMYLTLRYIVGLISLLNRIKLNQFLFLQKKRKKKA